MSQAPPNRIVSIDQFRGYSVAAMFLVNFMADIAAIHPVLKHNKIWFSYVIHELTMLTLGSKGHGLNLVPKDSPSGGA